MTTIRFTGDAEADELLSEEPLALLIGMLLDQQIRMEQAFAAPLELRRRLGHLDAARIAETDEQEFEEVFREQPALHRYPGSMSKRTRDLCAALVEDHGGDAAALWEGVEDGRTLKRRLKALPGFGDQKASIFVAVLAKRLGVAPEGWEAAAGGYAEDGHRSVADVAAPSDVERVRSWKQAQKAAKGG